MIRDLGELIYKFIVFFNGISKTLIPLSFTVYFFTYKEQKDVAISLFKKDKHFFNRYNVFLMMTVLIFISSIIYEPVAQEKLNIGNVLVFLIYLLWIFSAIFSYLFLVNSINIIRTFNESLNSIEVAFRNIEQERFKYKYKSVSEEVINRNITREVNKLSIYVEIVFQIIMSKKKYNLTNDFSQSLRDLEDKLFSQIILIHQDQSYFSEIFPLSSGEYGKLILIIQKGILELSDIALDLNNPRDIKILIQNFIEMRPISFEIIDELQSNWDKNNKCKASLETNFKNVFDEYYLSTYRVVNKLYSKNNSEALRVLKGLNQSDKGSELYANHNDYLTLVASMIATSIERNDLKQLTDVLNILFEYLSNMESRGVVFQKPFIDSKQKEESPSSSLINIKRIKDRVSETSSKELIEKKVHKLCIFSIVKAIELGRYSCAGFLIKNAVKNFNQMSFTESVYEINNNLDNVEPHLDLSKNLTRLLPLNFVFSGASYNYCFSKATLLIYYQQKYASLRKIKILKETEMINMMTIFKKEEGYLEYLNDKISGLEKEYGLIVLKRDEFEKVKIENNS